MKLYYTPNTISIAVAIVLEEAGIAYEAIKIDFATADQTKPEYLALNPKGRVPALALDDGTVLTETGALLEYVAALAPQKNLIPASPETAAHMRAVMYYAASTFHVAHAHRMRGTRWANEQSSFDDMAAKVPETMAACAAYVEAECLSGDYVAGSILSIADPYLFIICTWLSGDGVTVSDYPKITAFMARMNDRDSVRTMHAKSML